MQSRYSPGVPVLGKGAPLRNTATLNSILESAEDFERSRLGDQRSGRRELPNANTVKVKNSSGANRRAGEILEFNDYALNSSQIDQNNLWMVGGSPTLANAFGVLYRDLPNDKFGPCIVDGPCKALVNVTDAAHKFAEVSSGSYVLQSADVGAIRILYKAAGTGEKMCPVLIGGTAAPTIYRGITNTQINKGTTNQTVSRYKAGTNTDTGLDDTVTNDIASVGSGKIVFYIKLGSVFYILQTEKVLQSTLTNIREKADNTQIEAEQLAIFVDTVATAAYADKITLTTCS